MAEMSGEHRQLELRKRVVEISFTVPTPEDKSKRKTCFTLGIIVLATLDFCFVVLRRYLIKKDGIYTIKCDGKSIEIKAEDFVMSKGSFAGFYLYRDKLPYDINEVDAVEFGEEVELFDVVNLCDLAVGMCAITIGLTDGHVMNVSQDGREFIHNCAQSFYTKHGAPVFCKNHKLVGICILNLQGPSTASGVTLIKEGLMKMHQTKTLEKFFEVVRASAGNAEVSALATVQA